MQDDLLAGQVWAARRLLEASTVGWVSADGRCFEVSNLRPFGAGLAFDVKVVKDGTLLPIDPEQIVMNPPMVWRVGGVDVIDPTLVFRAVVEDVTAGQ